MKQIVVVHAENFVDTLYYETLEDARDFVTDQLDEGIFTVIASVDEVTDDEFACRMETMNYLDPSAERFFDAAINGHWSPEQVDTFRIWGAEI